MLILLVASAAAHARDDVPPALQSWLESLQHLQTSILADRAVQASWREEELAIPSPVDLQHLREQVANHPSHPDRGKLERYERRILHQDVELVQVWTGQGRVRASPTPQWRDDAYVDFAATPDTMWSMTPDSLSVSSTRHNDPSHDFLTAAMEYVSRASVIRSGGIGWIDRPDLHLKITEYDGHVWRASARAVDAVGRETVLVAQGTWDVLSNKGTVQHCTWSFHLKDLAQVATFEAKEWDVSFSSVPFTFPERLDQDEGDGITHRQYRDIAFRELDDASLHAATDLPTPDGKDILRGTKTFHSIVDFREMSLTHTDEAGQSQTVPLTALPSSPPRISLQTHGWYLAGSIILAIVCLRLRTSLRK